jgi:hypothetical protein
MTTLACRLIHASHLAYAIPPNGQPFPQTVEVNADIAGAGLNRNTLKSFQSPDDHSIDACYYGETTDGRAILAFRGTLPPTLDLKDEKEFIRILMDWLNDGKVLQVEGKNIQGRVHQGFLGSLNNLWPMIESFGIAKGKPLYITGHSKGGGLAFLAAARVWGQFKIKPAAVHTYAAPRVGNQEFALAYDAAMKDLTLRYEYQDDIVPHVPPHTGSWLHAFNAGQAAAAKIAAIIPPALAPVKSDFDAMLKRVGQLLQKMADHSDALESYVSSGTLQFIDWSTPPAILPDTWDLAIKRDLHLAELLLRFQFQRIIQDHSSERGYMAAPCGN